MLIYLFEATTRAVIEICDFSPVLLGELYSHFLQLVDHLLRNLFVFPAHHEPVILHFMILKMAVGSNFELGGVL